MLSVFSTGSFNRVHKTGMWQLYKNFKIKTEVAGYRALTAREGLSGGSAGGMCNAFATQPIRVQALNSSGC